MTAICGGRTGKLYYYNRIWRKAIMSYNGHLTEEDFDSVVLVSPLPYQHYQSYRFYDAITQK